MYMIITKIKEPWLFIINNINGIIWYSSVDIKNKQQLTNKLLSATNRKICMPLYIKEVPFVILNIVLNNYIFVITYDL